MGLVNHQIDAWPRAGTAVGGKARAPDMDAGSVREVSSAAREPAVSPSHRPTRRTLGWAVAIGGVVGSAARVGLGAVTAGVANWPVGTVLSNVIGCLVLGALWGQNRPRSASTPSHIVTRTAAMTGFCGGLTTFSSFVVDALVWPSGPSGAVLWIVGSVGSGVAAFVAGRYGARRLIGSVAP